MATTAPPKTQTASLTDYVAGFVTTAKAADIPKDVAHLGKRSVLDGIGLALAGAVSHQAVISRSATSPASASRRISTAR